MTEGGATRKRKRPSAKEARERMTRAVSSPAPISRAEEPAERDVQETSPRAAQSKKRTKNPDERGVGETRSARSGGDAATRREPAGRLVRLSVDVPADQHRRLRVMAAESGATGMSVIRALLAEMEDDADLAARVRNRLAEFGR